MEEVENHVFCLPRAEIELWKAQDGRQGSWRLRLQPGNLVMGQGARWAQITPCFSHHGCNSLGLFLPLAVALAPFLSMVQTEGKMVVLPRIGHEESVSGKLGFLLLFFKFKGFLPDPVSSSLFSDTLISDFQPEDGETDGSRASDHPLLFPQYKGAETLVWRDVPFALTGEGGNHAGRVEDRDRRQGCGCWNALEVGRCSHFLLSA